jgi:hypothetical protein
MMKRLAFAAALLIAQPLRAAPLGDWAATFANPSGDVESVSITRSATSLRVTARTKQSADPLLWSSTYANAFSLRAANTGAGAPPDIEAIVAEFSRPDGTKLLMILDENSGGSIRVRTFVDLPSAGAGGDYAVGDYLFKQRATILQRMPSPRPPRPLAAWDGLYENAASDLKGALVVVADGRLTLYWSQRCTPPCAEMSAPGVAFAPAPDARPADKTQSLIGVVPTASGRHILHLAAQSAGTLDAELYVDAKDSPDYVLRTTLNRKVATAPPAETPKPGSPGYFNEFCLAFLPDDIVISGWPWTARRLTYQGKALTTGASGIEARRARSIIQHYRMNRRCEVGDAITYWLADGRPPAGGYPGEDCVGIDPMRLSVKADPAPPNTKRWVIVSGDAHFAFAAPTAAMAEEAAAAIRHYGFARSCFVGRPGPSMVYLRK